MTRVLAALAAACVLGGAGPAHAQAAAATADGARPRVVVRPGAQVRWRTERWRNQATRPDGDDTYSLLRVFGHLDIAMGRHVRVFLQGRSSLAWDRSLPGGRRASDVDTLDLWNTYADLTFEPAGYGARVRAGRQELSLGAQRLISPINWSNTRRIFDGLRTTVAAPDGRWGLDAFWLRPVRVRKYAPNPGVEGGRLAGVYAATAAGPARVEGYLLSTRRTGATAAGGPARWTVGARVEAGGERGPALEGEAAWQWGEDVRAAMVSVAPRYTWPGPRAPFVGVGLDYATGDPDPADGLDETFDPLFPLGHGWLGFADVVGRRNLRAVRVPTGFAPVPGRVTVAVDLHWFRLATPADALYATSGRETRRTPGGTGVGSEQDVTVAVRLDPRAVLTVGVHRFAPGDVFAGAPHDTVYHLYAQAQREF